MNTHILMIWKTCKLETARIWEDVHNRGNRKWPYSFFFFFWRKKHLNALLFTLQFWAGLDVKEPLVIRCCTPTCLFWEDGDRFVLTLKDLSFDSTGFSSKVMADEEEEDEPEDEDELEGQWEKREDEGIAGLLGILIDLLPIRLTTLLAVSVPCGDSEVVLLVDTSSWSFSTTCFSIAKAWEFSCTLSDMRSVAAAILSPSKWTFSELCSMQLVARCNVFRNSFRPFLLCRPCMGACDDLSYPMTVHWAWGSGSGMRGGSSRFWRRIQSMKTARWWGNPWGLLGKCMWHSTAITLVPTV